MQDDLCQIIIEKYYAQIYRYCYVRLNHNEPAAKDCTQEIFLIMLEKQRRLNLSGNMRVWLYKTADRVMKNYIRREIRHNHLDLEQLDIRYDDSFASYIDCPQLDCLTTEEYELLFDYYGAMHGDKEAVAEKHGLTLYRLYREVERLKKKTKPPK